MASRERPGEGFDEAGGHIPLFPLNTVLFPGGSLPLRIFEPRYLDMTALLRKAGTRDLLDAWPRDCWQDAGWVSWRVAERLPLPVELRVELLAIDDVTARLRRIAGLLAAGGTEH